MSTNVRRLVIGIDWGIHSSKWWYSATLSGGKTLQPSRIPGVIDSTIYRGGANLVVARERGRTGEYLTDRRLKRLLLGDPQGASYWDAVRDGIGISLGKASTLTIACLLGDVEQQLKAEGLELAARTEIAIRFSLPNWIGDDAEHRAARLRMYQTSVVSAALIDSIGWGGPTETRR